MAPKHPFRVNHISRRKLGVGRRPSCCEYGNPLRTHLPFPSLLRTASAGVLEAHNDKKGPAAIPMGSWYHGPANLDVSISRHHLGVQSTCLTNLDCVTLEGYPGTEVTAYPSQWDCEAPEIYRKVSRRGCSILQTCPSQYGRTSCLGARPAGSQNPSSPRPQPSRRFVALKGDSVNGVL